MCNLGGRGGRGRKDTWKGELSLSKSKGIWITRLSSQVNARLVCISHVEIVDLSACACTGRRRRRLRAQSIFNCTVNQHVHSQLDFLFSFLLTEFSDAIHENKRAWLLHPFKRNLDAHGSVRAYRLTSIPMRFIETYQGNIFLTERWFFKTIEWLR